jgi:hypothetical protein
MLNMILKNWIFNIKMSKNLIVKLFMKKEMNLSTNLSINDI